MIKTLRTTLAVAALALMPVMGSAATVGNDAIDRATRDSFSNFAFAFTADVFTDGTITNWSAFTTGSGDIGLMVLDVVSPNEFSIAALDIRSVTNGFNTFTSSIAVASGQILGLYQGDAKVEFDLSGAADDVYSSNGFFNSNALNVGTTFTGSGTTARIYSINAEVEDPAAVPLPAGLPMMLAGLGLVGLLRRRNRAA